MADSLEPNNLQDVLKPLFQRASDAEERLSKLEAALARERGASCEEHLRTISQLESEVELAKSKLVSEQEKTKELALENAKFQYRITHLLRALRETD